MDKLSTRKLVDGYHRAFIDATRESDPTFSPSLLSNSHGRKVLTAIEKEMKGCDDLFISVAFITMGGIVQETEQRNRQIIACVRGYLVQTAYSASEESAEKINSVFSDLINCRPVSGYDRTMKK